MQDSSLKPIDSKQAANFEVIKVGLVGCGQIADGHAEELSHIKGVRLVACADLEPLMARQFSIRNHQIPHYTDPVEMIHTEGLGALHICTPPQFHQSLANLAFANSCHAYIEKPIGLNAAQTRAIVEAASRAGLHVTAGHGYWYDPLSVRVRKLITSGAIGEVCHVEAWFGYNMLGPFGKNVIENPSHWINRIPGKVMQNNLNHLLEKWFYFSDVKPVVLSATSWQSGELASLTTDETLLDELRVIVKGAEGVSGSFTFSSATKNPEHFLSVIGSEGRVCVDYGRGLIAHYGNSKLPGVLSKLGNAASYGFAGISEFGRSAGRFARSQARIFAGTGALMKKFYDGILSGGEDPIPGHILVSIEELMEEMLVAAGASVEPHRE